MSFVIRFIDTRECIFVDDLLAYWQTKVNEYEIRVVVKKKEKFERIEGSQLTWRNSRNLSAYRRPWKQVKNRFSLKVMFAK